MQEQTVVQDLFSSGEPVCLFLLVVVDSSCCLLAVLQHDKVERSGHLDDMHLLDGSTTFGKWAILDDQHATRAVNRMTNRVPIEKGKRREARYVTETNVTEDECSGQVKVCAS